jgi:hypothetical protein
MEALGKSLIKCWTEIHGTVAGTENEKATLPVNFLFSCPASQSLRATLLSTLSCRTNYPIYIDHNSLLRSVSLLRDWTFDLYVDK